MDARVLAAVVLALLVGATAVALPVSAADAPPADGSERTLGAGHEPIRMDAAGIRPGAVGKTASSARQQSTGHGDATDSGVRRETVLNASYRYRRLPDRPGVVEVTMRLPATRGIERVNVGLDWEGLSVVETTNVERNGSTYEWTGDTDAKIVYRQRLTEDYLGNWRDSWTMAGHKPPSILTESAVNVNRTIVTDGGYVGGNVVLLGEYDVYRRQVDGETIDLVVPGDVSLLYGPRRTLGALANASRALDIGGRDEVVHVFVTPRIRYPLDTDYYDPAGASDDRVLVDADATLDVYIHEYVHTRQEFADPTARRTRQAAARAESIQWLAEGSARFYERRLSAEFGYASWGPLRNVFGKAANDTAVLSDRDTWTTGSDYRKGALVMAAIDRKIRATTDGNHTIEDAIRRVNGDEPTVEDFIEAVREIGGSAAAATARKFVTTSAVPDVQTQSAGLAAVYGNATRIKTQTVGLSATNATRTRQLDRTDTQIEIGLNETLRLTVRIENTGSVRGLATVAPPVTQVTPDPKGADLERFDSPWIGWVSPGETIERTVTHRFDRPGTYEIEIDGVTRYEVTVVSYRGTASDAGRNRTRTTVSRQNSTRTTPSDGRATKTTAVEAETTAAGTSNTVSAGETTTQATGDTAVFGVTGVLVALTALVVAARVRTFSTQEWSD
jgi:hypothetical protein